MIKNNYMKREFIDLNHLFVEVWKFGELLIFDKYFGHCLEPKFRYPTFISILMKVTCYQNTHTMVIGGANL